MATQTHPPLAQPGAAHRQNAAVNPNPLSSCQLKETIHLSMHYALLHVASITDKKHLSH